LRDRGRSHRARGETDAACLQEITTFHALPHLLLPIPRRGTTILTVVFGFAGNRRLLIESGCCYWNPGSIRFRAQDDQSKADNQAQCIHRSCEEMQGA
jgi:hypothetical protein